MVYPKIEYEVIGSGVVLWRLVIKQIKSMAIGGSLYISSEEEVKEWDSQTGGETRVVVINSKGLKAFPPDELKIYV